MNISQFLPQGAWQEPKEKPRLLLGLSQGKVTGIILQVDGEYALSQLGVDRLPEIVRVPWEGEDFLLTPKRAAAEVASASLALHITLLPAHLGLFVQEWLEVTRSHGTRATLRTALRELVKDESFSFRYRLGSTPLLLVKPQTWDVDHGFPVVGEGTRPGWQMSAVLTAEVEGIAEFDKALFALFSEEESRLLQRKGLDYRNAEERQRLHATLLVANPPGGLPVSTVRQLKEFFTVPLTLHGNR